MILTQLQIDKFQSLYRDRFGVEISQEDAARIGSRLIEVMRVIYCPVNGSEIELEKT